MRLSRILQLHTCLLSLLTGPSPHGTLICFVSATHTKHTHSACTNTQSVTLHVHLFFNSQKSKRKKENLFGVAFFCLHFGLGFEHELLDFCIVFYCHIQRCILANRQLEAFARCWDTICLWITFSGMFLGIDSEGLWISTWGTKTSTQVLVKNIPGKDDFLFHVSVDQFNAFVVNSQSTL